MLLRSTLHGSGGEVELGSHTLIWGPTGSGKTTILASLGLVLTGQGDDIAGREAVKSGSELALTMDEDSEIFIELVGEASKMSYKLVPGKSAVTNGLPANPWRHPVRMVRDALRQSPDKARAALAAWAFVAPVPLARMLPEGMASDPRFAAIVGTQLDEPSVEELTKAVATAQAKAAQHSKDARADQSAADALERGLGTPPTADQLQAAEAAVQVLRNKAATLMERDRAHETRAREIAAIQTRMAAIEREVAAIQHHYVEVRAIVSTEPPPEPKGLDQLRAVGRLYSTGVSFVEQALTQTSGSNCPVCGGSTSREDLQQRKEAIQAEIAKLETYFATVEGTVRQRQEHAAAQKQLEQLGADYNALVAEFQELQQRASTLHPIEPVDSQTLIAELTAGETTLAQLRASNDSWEKVRRLRRSATEHTNHAKWASDVVEALTHVIDRIYTERSSELETRVSEYLPQGYGLSLRLQTASGKPTLRLCLKLPSGQISYDPSGGERAALFMALTAALIDMGRLPIPEEGPVFLFYPEERGMSPDWLRDVMVALSKVTTARVVLASLHPPKRSKVRGWEIIELSHGPRPAPVPENGAGEAVEVDEAPVA